ncbi:hypothetical protein PIROE2DRAFT_63458 [Piromyces sp. E2]|nr:hypothetical protein PIROE2DRAFT_63458 [Piromyces sp. E2]|eukprot:OUM59931.1 hypothetical protein PIROE2DRAFT_63458 [Piromyces sp. E2]
MKLELTSNIFSKNKGENGGALYFGMEKENNIYDNRTISIEDNNFYENEAYFFGGAIYTEYDKYKSASIKNNKISYNKAGVMGGGIYSKNSIDLKGYEFVNNTSSSLIENYISKPSTIKLDTVLKKNTELNTGEYLPLSFTLQDESGNTIVDITKYYSLLTLRFNLVKKNDYTIENNLSDKLKDNFYLTGNIGSFIYGKKKNYK